MREKPVVEAGLWVDETHFDDPWPEADCFDLKNLLLGLLVRFIWLVRRNLKRLT